ncbi:metallophosphoesterase family protein [Sphingobium sp. CR28]|uniref:metallophosphoesterase family protein n=1 Tax=Sphingobium sp. CR28 TaxID=3400272 RepID=UPI003FF07551
MAAGADGASLMRIAVLSDIHGNLPALEAVLADIERHGVDQIVNLGDSLSGPLWPAETAARLIALDLPTIAGNHERQLLTEARETMCESDRFAAERLDDAAWRWLASLPPTRDLPPDALMVHGTPDSDLDGFLETVTPTGARPATIAEVVERTSGSDAALILCGHTHMPRIVALADGPLFVNPGSVGLPAYRADWPHPHVMETGSPHARYALVTRYEGGWYAELRRVGYDWRRAAAKADAEGRSDWSGPLRTGFA